MGSPDGNVRPFDKGANGTVFGDSVGAVVLKRREDAEADGDNILAVLRGWGLSNDGREKAGFSAPAAYGQSLAIEDAMIMAMVTPDSMSYVESHATATNVGDGIEVMGLRMAYDRLNEAAAAAAGDKPATTVAAAAAAAATTSKTTALGSIKGNIAHANAAAGVTGFIKTVLMLQHRQMVPTAHLQAESDKLAPALADSALFVHKAKGLKDWTGAVEAGTGRRYPLRAGVSSFGIGGANAHCVLEEHPSSSSSSSVVGGGESMESAATAAGVTTESSSLEGGGVGGVHLLTVSGKTETALAGNMARMAEYLHGQKGQGGGALAVSCAKVAYTLHVGRESFKYRFACAFPSLPAAATALESALSRFSSGEEEPAASRSDHSGGGPVSVAFVFPGQGSQYLRMGEVKSFLRTLRFALN